MDKDTSTVKLHDQDDKVIKKREISNQPNISQPNGRDQSKQKVYNGLAQKTVQELASYQKRMVEKGSKRIFFRRQKRSNRPPPPVPDHEKSSEQLEMERVQKQKDVLDYEDKITYSSKYFDDVYEYRHVILPLEIARWLPHHGLMTEEECRALGVSQSVGWQHYMVHAPEPHILLFRRERGFLEKYPELAEKMKEEQEAKKKEKEEELTKTRARDENMAGSSESSNAKPDAFVPEKP
ncbi:hypothetical protein G6F70_006729 [Rhizopus microsporus]|uniref:Cyclin-dependent kinases regulatory subunit n=2 Tax=Rhizopus TaxID=4842 RepID=A0A367JDS4_RHIAZ|nr:hypothetical protein G6F71_004102 [Rhizopus microsporus]RCH87871.1 hypothetical protein CU097_004876 [Rhizopus azygosporus]KAG1197310.1 hypothetical protein G6F70_006729 [Rhizopus microsporus]KAG1208871.1 hypothetical protein G6F69_006850 [Rhizopus microsporus]KAG1235165.1 hypothetical protein G6F67_002988 [Rhizopus microsporus]